LLQWGKTGGENDGLDAKKKTGLKKRISVKQWTGLEEKKKGIKPRRLEKL